VLDTAALQLVASLDVLLARLEDLITAIREAQVHRHTVMVGRSHGIHAEPITFGFKLAGGWQKCCGTKIASPSASTDCSRQNFRRGGNLCQY